MVVVAKVVVAPKQTVFVPVIGATVGKAFTVITRPTELEHPFEFVRVYLILVPPTLTPATTPALVIVATSGVKLLHIPPNVSFESVIVEPTQTLLLPLIAAIVGKLFTVTRDVAVVEQLFELVTV